MNLGWLGVLNSKFYVVLLWSLFFSCPFGVPAKAYTLTTAPSGEHIRWRHGQKFFLAGNPGASEGFSSKFFWNAVVNGLQQWKWASHSFFDFEYWQGTDKEKYAPRLSQDGLNSIFFASNSNETVDPNIIGFTQVWFNNSTGELIEADIMLNDKNYELTEDSHDTSSGTSREWSARKKVYLGNIITHELGHAIGLSHSGHINSSMLYVEYSEQSQLGCDDWAGVRHLYHPKKDGTGELRGAIISPSGEAVAGTQVTAISHERGIPLASTLTDQNGQFSFAALEAGTFALLIEPFKGSNASVPARVKRGTATVCSEDSYPANFYTMDDGHALNLVSVSSGKTANVGQIKIKCTGVEDQGEVYPATTSFAPSMFVDKISIDAERSYRFLANGPFRITGLGYLLMSSIKVDLTVTDKNGEIITTKNKSPLYTASASDFTIQDTEIRGEAYGEITVRVSPSALSARSFPTPTLWPGTTPYYVINFNSNAGKGFASDLPSNARCAPPETFETYQSPPTNPIRFGATQSVRDSIGFCGNAEAASMKAKRAPTRLGSVLGWFFPFFVAFAAHFFLRSLRFTR